MNQLTLDFHLDAKGQAPADNHFGAIASGEQPQQRLENFGAAALSDTELLAMLLGSGIRGHSVLALSSRLIAEAGSISGLASWHAADFRRLKGIGRIKGLQLVALMEIARRVIQGPGTAAPLLNCTEAIVAYLKPFTTGLEVEKFWVLCLNRKNRLRKLVEVSSGTATQTLVHPREVFRAAIREGATAIVIAHNHPSSGDPAPSLADVEITRLLHSAAKTVEIDLHDHIIIGRMESDPFSRGFYSFREAGLI